MLASGIVKVHYLIAKNTLEKKTLSGRKLLVLARPKTRNPPPNVCAAPKACESGETRHEDCDTSFLAVLAAGA
eukprot:symbB.v1.2.029190.t1/scaffold3168.1/size62061/3